MRLGFSKERETRVIDRRSFVSASATAAAALAVGCERTPSSADGPTLIVGANVFDVRTGAMRPNTSLLLDGERIDAVAPTSELNASSSAVSGAEIVDGSGTWIAPGLIDAHVHLSHILYQSQMTGDEVLPFYLGHGVTSIRGTGDNVPAQTMVARYADSRPDTSPRVFRCSFLIDRDPPWHTDVGWPLTDVDQVAPFVEEMAAWGVTTLKLYIGVTREIGRRVIEEGHARGLVVSGHLLDYHTGDAVQDGLDCVEHIYTVSNFLLADPDDRHSIDLDSVEASRLVDTIAESGARVDPTLMVFWGTLLFMDQPEVFDHADNLPVPGRLRRFWAKDRDRRMLDWGSAPLAVREATWAKYLRLTGMLRAAGVQLLVGTDAPEPQVAPGASLHHEMELLVESGMTPAEVLTAATLENARILRQDDEIGSIEPGRLADLILLDADPLEDIRNSRRIRHVVRGGRVLDPAAILLDAPTE
ncbi:MAG: amidohydrolase family protein [Gemmatimonadota bacterium]|nr:amidohydrolase family protein [Gemmatimonadota bacterium]